MEDGTTNELYYTKMKTQSQTTYDLFNFSPFPRFSIQQKFILQKQWKTIKSFTAHQNRVDYVHEKADAAPLGRSGSG